MKQRGNTHRQGLDIFKREESPEREETVTLLTYCIPTTKHLYGEVEKQKRERGEMSEKVTSEVKDENIQMTLLMSP